MNKIIEEARQEIAKEEHRKMVEEAKKRLLEKRSLWVKLFPFTLVIKRR